MSSEIKVDSLLKELKEIVRSYHEEKTLIANSIKLTTADLMELLEVSRSTLYRWRVSGALTYQILPDNTIVYSFDETLLAIKCGRVRAKGFRKLDAIKKLNAFKYGIIRSNQFMDNENIEE